ncbi:hypothetical protein MP228_000122 [Amoeboaphelidium protococcarum]|nr:hypothetical protein MP228_000122 [Amoeboaphelidium protococcarum]
MIKLNIKQSNDIKYHVEIEKTSTVLQLKEKIASEKEIPANEQRLIYSGRVLKDPDTLETYKIEDGHTIHLVKGRSTAAPAPSASTGQASAGARTAAPASNPAQSAGSATQGAANPFSMFGQPPQFGGAGAGMGMNNPMMNTMMQQMLQNPQFMESLMQSNPMLQQMGMSPEQLRSIMQDPMFQSMMQNPQLMEQMMQMQGAGGLGGGFGGMGGFGGVTSPPSQQPQQQQSGGNGGNAQQQLPPLGGPFMNPFMMNPALMQSMLGGGAAGAGANNAQPAANQDPPEIRFSSQLQQLQDMGFYDTSANIRAISATGGNVNAAVEYLLSMGGAPQ